MKYAAKHKRINRGEQICKTLEEKKVERKEKTMIQEFLPEITRERIEAKYLVPQPMNFIETPEISDIKKRVAFWLELGYPVHIIGPTGCGKTTLAMQVAKERGRPAVWINGDEQITTTDLIGGYSQVETETIRDKYIHNVFKDKDIFKADWVDNPLTLACKYGYTLVYNEFSRTLPVANNVLLSIFEEGILELPTKFGEERYVKVHPEFAAIFTSNSVEYAGVHRPQDALLDRLIGIYMNHYNAETERAIVMAHTNLSKSQAEKVVNIVRLLRERLGEAEQISMRAGVMLGEAVQADSCDLEQLCLDILTSKTKNAQDLAKKQKILKEVLREVV